MTMRISLGRVVKLLPLAVMILCLAGCKRTLDPMVSSSDVVMYVSSELDLSGCMKVREDGEMNVQLFQTDAIRGFEYEPGYDYELKVRKTEVVYSWTDIRYDYELVKILSKEEAAVPALAL